ncbi:MAG: UvrD-helicase domain-containing protein [Planctomycetaceae bacterium]
MKTLKVAKRMKPSAASADLVTTDDIASMRPLLIRASAGTGKTYQLTGRLLRILLGGAPPDSVIATTFTRKAAGEILTRVLLSLARAATDSSDRARQQLADQTGLSQLTAADCIALTHALLRDIHRLRILTLDSLFSQLARSFSYEIGVPPGWRLTDEIEDVAMRESAVDAMLSHLQATDLVALLAQLGKGDTKRSVRTEMVRVVEDGYQISRGCEEQAWDSLHVPRGPAEEAIRDAVVVLSQAAVGNKSADKYLRRLGEWMDEGAWEQVAEMPLVCTLSLIATGDDVTYYGKAMPEEIALALRVAAAGAKTHVLGLLRAQTLATGRVIAAYDAQVAAIKQASRAFSFDDIAYRLAQSMSPVSMHQIATRMDGAIDHLLLDEFQDTSPVQWSVLRPLATATARENAGGSFFCVGDTKQAIYGWRGGVAEIFDQVCSQLSNVAQREQNTSYRSSPVIVEAVNQIFKNLHRHPVVSAAASSPSAANDGAEPMRLAVAGFVNSFPTHRSARPELPGYVSIRSSDAKAKDVASRKLSHLKFVADRIAESARLVPDRTIGVLTRTNLSVAWLIQMLRVAGVNVSQEGGNPLVDSPAVELVLSTLMMTEHPGDRRWAFHVAHSPLAAWLELSQFDQAEASTMRLRRMIEDDGIARAVETIASQLVPNCDEGDALRLRQLVYLAQQYEVNRGERIGDFVHFVQHKRVEKPRPAQVRVMTVHQAKGLEFDVVVLPELDSELVQSLSGTIGLREQIDQPPKGLLRFIRKDAWPLLPQVWQQCFSDQVQATYTESLCLLYVALTRARQWLDIIVQPAAHPQPKAKTAASLLYHAVACECDATQPNQVWFEAGDSHWYQT